MTMETVLVMYIGIFSLFYLVRDCSLHLFHQYLTNVQSYYRQFGPETIHPTQKFTSMNLLQQM